MLLEVELRPTGARKITCVMQVYLTETPLCGNFLVVSSGTSFDSLDRVRAGDLSMRGAGL
jgi:hypothetical protein